MANKGKAKADWRVTVEPDKGRHRLFVSRSDCGPAPAGDRHKRGDRLPISDFIFDDEKEAGKAAVKLQSYLNKNTDETE